MLQYLRSTDLCEDQATSIETAHMSAISLLETVNDIIDLRQIEIGKLIVSKRDEPISKVRLLVKEIVEIFAFRAYEKGFLFYRFIYLFYYLFQSCLIISFFKNFLKFQVFFKIKKKKKDRISY